MLQLPTTEQFMFNYSLVSYPGFTVQHLTITRPVGATIMIDELTVPDAVFVAIGPDWEVARVQVTDGAHNLSGDAAFGVFSTGYREFDSYAYPGGLHSVDPVCGG